MNRMHIQLSKIMYLCVPNTIHVLLLISEEQVPSSADFSYLGHDVLIFRGEIVTHSGGASLFAKCIKCKPQAKESFYTFKYSLDWEDNRRVFALTLIINQYIRRPFGPQWSQVDIGRASYVSVDSIECIKMCITKRICNT